MLWLTGNCCAGLNNTGLLLTTTGLLLTTTGLSLTTPSSRSILRTAKRFPESVSLQEVSAYVNRLIQFGNDVNIITILCTRGRGVGVVDGVFMTAPWFSFVCARQHTWSTHLVNARAHKHASVVDAAHV